MRTEPGPGQSGGVPRRQFPDFPAAGYYDRLLAAGQDLISGNSTPQEYLETIEGPYNTAVLGLDALALNWLGEQTSAIVSLMVILVWLQLGYTIVVFMAGLARIDISLHEAAQLDGANWLQRFRVITVPELRPEIAVVLLTTTVAALKVFAPIYAITKGGPGTATMVPSFFSFFSQSRVGYGSAISTVLALVIGLLAVFLLRYQLRKEG